MKPTPRRRGLGPVTVLARVELRNRWVSVISVGLLLGLVGGIGIACLAGARRTSTVMSRHLQASDAPDLEIDPGSFSPEADRALRQLPGVIDAGYWVTYSAFKLGADGEVDDRFADALAFTTDGRYLDMDRIAVADGRRLDPTRPDEVMVNEAYAKAAGVGVGSRMDVGLFALDDQGSPEKATPDRRMSVRVVGIMAINEEITGEELDVIGRLFVSPAAAVQPVGRADYYGFAWYGLRLRGGSAAVAGVQRRWNELAAAHNAKVGEADLAGTPFGGGNWLTYVHVTGDLQRKASRAVRPLTTTLAAFGLLMLGAAIVLASQALSRSVRLAQDELRIARVLGLTSVQATLVAMAVPLAALGLALVAGAVVAVAASTRFPVGPFKVFEPAPGLHVDIAVLGLALALLVLLPLTLVAVSALRSVRIHGGIAAGRTARPSRLAALVGRTSRSPSAAAAVRLTVEPGEGRSFVPTRSMLVSVALTVTVLVTVLVFGSNLSALDRDPSRFGWPADGVFASDGGYSPFDQAKVTAWLHKQDAVTRWRLASAGLAVIDGTAVPSVVFGPGYEGFAPTLLSGRAPSNRGEVVLGTATMRTLRAKVGDVVDAGSGRRRTRVRITGTAVFPVLGPVLAVRTGLDRGAWFDIDDYLQLDNIQAMIDQYGAPMMPYFSLVLYDRREGVSAAALQRAIRTSGVGTGSSDDAYGVIRPSEVRTATAAGVDTQVLLCGLLAFAAGLSMLLTLVAVVRRRRSELALYRILGFTPSQVRRTLLAQGALVASVGIVLGLTFGIAAGRTLWRLFAIRLGVVPDPSQPVLGLAVAAMATLLIGLLSAVGPAIAASRVPPAAGIRSE